MAGDVRAIYTVARAHLGIQFRSETQKFWSEKALARIRGPHERLPFAGCWGNVPGCTLIIECSARLYAEPERAYPYREIASPARSYTSDRAYEPELWVAAESEF